ncbi:MAG: RsmE family RNA methyltransferase [Syntrophobacter sp.]
MSRKCFFAQGIGPETETVELSSEESHHMENVLRLGIGEAVEIRDGLGNAWAGEIAGKGRKNVSVRVLGRLDLSHREPLMHITLALGIARSDLMDIAVRQATEMGVRRLAVFRASRSQYALHERIIDKKVGRWAKIAREAMCQCGRTRVPDIAVFEDTNHFLGNTGEQGGKALKIFALEGERNRSLELLRGSRSLCDHIVAVVGPEGGWDQPEIEGLMSAGFQPVHLGPRILRFETAVVAMVSLIQLLWGDFGEMERKENDENEMQ